MSAEQLLSALNGVQGRGPKYRAICPAHISKTKSRTLAIHDSDDGRVLLKCFAGCDVDSIVRALGMDLADLFPPRVSDENRPPPIKKPWLARDAVEALRHELTVAWIILGDVARGQVLQEADQQRAGMAKERIGHIIAELTNAA